MARSGKTSRVPLLPVKPERDLRFGLKATSSASTLRLARSWDTVVRRDSNSFASSGAASRSPAAIELLSKNERFIRELEGLAQVAITFDVGGEFKKRLDAIQRF